MLAKKSIVIEFKGGINLSSDSSIIPESDAVSAINGVTSSSAFAVMPSRVLWATTNHTNVAMWLWERYYGSTPLTFAIIGDKIYTKTASTRTLVSAVTLSAAPTQKASTCLLADNYLVASGHSNKIQWYNGTAWADLTNATSYKPKYIAYFASRVVIADMVDTAVTCRFRFRYSETGSLTTWTGGTTGFVDLVEDLDAITGLKVLGDRLFLFRENSIWEISHVGGDLIWAFAKIATGVGCWSPDSLILAKDTLLFMSRTGLYALSAGGLQPIGQQINNNFVGEKFLLGVDDSPNDPPWASRTSLKTSVAAFLDSSNQYFLLVPRTTTATDYLDKMYTYDFDTKAWSTVDLLDTSYKWPQQFISSERYDSTNTMPSSEGDFTLSQAPATGRDTLVGMIRSANDTGYGYVVQWCPENIQEINPPSSGGTMTLVEKTAYWYSKEFSLPSSARYLSLTTEFLGDLSIYYTLDRGVTWTLVETIVQEATYDSGWFLVLPGPTPFITSPGTDALKLEAATVALDNPRVDWFQFDVTTNSIMFKFELRGGDVTNYYKCDQARIRYSKITFAERLAER